MSSKITNFFDIQQCNNQFGGTKSSSQQLKDNTSCTNYTLTKHDRKMHVAFMNNGLYYNDLLFKPIENLGRGNCLSYSIFDSNAITMFPAERCKNNESECLKFKSCLISCLNNHINGDSYLGKFLSVYFKQVQGYSDDEYVTFVTDFVNNGAYCGDELIVLVALFSM